MRQFVVDEICARHPTIQVIESKCSVDMVVCKEAPVPSAFFIEAKFHTLAGSRIGFGDSRGQGFQPDIVKTPYGFFESNLRWVLGSELHNGLLFLPTEVIRNYVAGKSVGPKFNNIGERIFREQPLLSPTQLHQAFCSWLSVSS